MYSLVLKKKIYVEFKLEVEYYILTISYDTESLSPKLQTVIIVRTTINIF